MKSKNERLGIIRRLVTKERVGSQEELIRLLEKEGLNVAQATLSRDLREMGITKVHDGLGYRFRLPSASEPVNILRASGGAMPDGLVVSCEFCGNLCVLKTHPGHAPVLSALIDGKSLPFVAGTVAGDDTVLVVLRGGFSRADMTDGLSGLFSGIKKKIIE